MRTYIAPYCAFWFVVSFLFCLAFLVFHSYSVHLSFPHLFLFLSSLLSSSLFFIFFYFLPSIPSFSLSTSFRFCLRFLSPPLPSTFHLTSFPFLLKLRNKSFWLAFSHSLLYFNEHGGKKV